MKIKMKEVLDYLDSKNIKYELVEHEEVHTIEDMKKVGLLDKGYVCKTECKWKNAFSPLLSLF